jgi:hypothetical protein
MDMINVPSRPSELNDLFGAFWCPAARSVEDEEALGDGTLVYLEEALRRIWAEPAQTFLYILIFRPASFGGTVMGPGWPTGVVRLEVARC